MYSLFPLADSYVDASLSMWSVKTYIYIYIYMYIIFASRYPTSPSENVVEGRQGGERREGAKEVEGSEGEGSRRRGECWEKWTGARRTNRRGGYKRAGPK